ncbi:hypothetical protein KBJ98_02005 [Flavobacterium sp. F-328]|uniref:Phage tail tape measure protein domain-containing protein n=1 Tax=Flavobacterium erciyesense TaxID=2825842 RepID=A0ABS5D0C2_9FLAO|nr:phage tail tape measure protein [Flavobacterium erciyesense]MBQ0907469.1 hypothetical protein [Flavobacterium erciyesense]
MAGRKEIPREISIYVNDVAVVNSFTGINRAIRQTNNEIGALNKNSETYEQDLQRLKTTLSELQEKQSEFKEEIQGTNMTVGQFKESISQIFTGLQSGDLETAKEGFEGIKGSISGMVKSAAAFIATPLGAAIAVISTIAIGTKAIFDFNQGLQESNKLLEAFGLQGDQLRKVRSEIQATAETFDKDFKEIGERANSLAKTYGISMSEANAEIARGLADGGAQNSEFLDSLGEYDEFFAKAGYSARDFVNIVNTGFDLGIYSDKLPDALKEADLSLREQTKATRDALTNAFGASFTDTILAKVSSGEITTKTALENIAQKAKETGLTQQQQAQLTADVFRGAGEDAGGALKILEAVGASSKRELSESAKASLELVEANERLNKAQSDLFEIEGFSSIWTNIKIESTDALTSILEWILDVKKDIQPLIDFVGVVFVNAWHGLKTSVQIAFDVVGGVLKSFSNTIGTIFNFVIKLFKGDFSGALNVLKNGFTKLATIVGDTFAKIKNHVIDGLKSIINNVAPFLDAVGIDVDKLQKKLDGLKSKNIVLKTTPETNKPNGSNPDAAATKITAEELAKQKALRDAARQKEIDANQKALDKKKSDQQKHDKLIWDQAMSLAKSQSDLAKAELDSFITNNRTKIDSTKQLTPELIAEETKRLDEIKFRQQNALAEKRLNDIAKAEHEIKSETELANVKKAIDLEYLTAEQNLELQFLDATTVLKKQYEEQQKQLALEQLQAENQLQVIEADTKAQQESIKQAQDYRTKLAGYKKLLEDKKITQSQYDRFEKAAKKEQETLDRARELQQLQGTLGGLNQVAGAIGEMFGQSKGLAIAQAGINGAMAVTSILAQYPKFDGGFAMWAAIAAAGITTIAQVGKITNTKSPKTPKFFYGGFNNSDGSGGPTGNTAYLGTDEYGKITGVTHDEEWIAPKVMTQSPRYAATFSWLENERKSMIGNKFFNGGESSSGTVAPFVANSTNDDALLIAINKLNDHLDRGIKSTALIGYKEAKNIKELNDEREMSNQYGIISQ